MENSSRLVLALVALSIVVASHTLAGDFGGYYTRFSKEGDGDAVGEHADIVVRIDANRHFVFSRYSSYLPYLQIGGEMERKKLTHEFVHGFVGGNEVYVTEIVRRKGDGDAKRPDKANQYSYVRLIENTPEKVVVHWRYMADFANVEWDGVVDEYYTIKPTGQVERIARVGTPKRKDWDDPANRHVQTFRLTESGITDVKYTAPKVSNSKGAAIKGAPIRKGSTDGAAARFHFDEGMKENDDLTSESVSNTACTVGGHKTVWREGVSGTSLMFDGYYTKVTLPNSKAPAIKDQLTIQAWVALGAYPFNWGPIVQQSEWEKSGYYLGVDSYGHLGFMLHAGGEWKSIQASSGTFETDIELFRWYHVAAIYDGETMRLFIDGKPVASGPASGAITLPQRDLVIGLNTDKLQPTSPIRPQVTFPSIFGIDGLIDEVSIHKTALSEQDISTAFAQTKPSDTKPDLETRTPPAGPDGKKADAFGASYENLRYHAGFDNMWRVSDHPDIVVKFDRFPTRFVFWKGLRFSPGMVTENNKWSGDQSSENFGKIKDKTFEYPGAFGCVEHMSDAQCRHSHVRIIENTPARVVIHWRYAMIDVRYKHWGDRGSWEDEYYTIYPDGVAIRWVSREAGAWQETLFYNAPGEKPEDNVHFDAYTVVNAEGKEKTYSWAKAPSPFPKIEKDPEIYLEGKPLITMVNLKSTFRPYYIYRADGGVHTFAGEVRPEFSRFPWWNHYPVSQAISDGRSAERADRMTHSSLIGGGIPKGRGLMIGLTDQPAASLLPQTKSWAQAPTTRDFEGGAPSLTHKSAPKSGYHGNQREYRMAMENHTVSFTLEASDESPIHNVCFRVMNWGMGEPGRVLVDGKPYENVSQGTVLGTEGNYELVAFVELESTKPTRFTITKVPAETTTLIDRTMRNGSFEADGPPRHPKHPKKPLSVATDWDAWKDQGKEGGGISIDSPTDGAANALMDANVAICNMTAHTIQVGDRISWSYDQLAYNDRPLSSWLVYDNNGTITKIDATEITRDRWRTYGNVYTIPPGDWVGKKLGIGFYSPKQASNWQSLSAFDNVELKVGR